MPSLLLVTGSRALARNRGGTKKSVAWAYDRCGEAIVGENRPDLVVAGDAEGPDTIACTVAGTVRPRILWRVFALDGWLYHCDVGLRRWRNVPGPATWPLSRNMAMVAAVVKARDAGWHVRVLGLVAPWSRTRGSDHTLGVAKRAGLEVTRLECPAAYGMAANDGGKGQ